MTPDYTADASMLGWTDDPHTWPMELTPRTIEAHGDVLGHMLFRFDGYHYLEGWEEIAGAIYRAEDGRTIRVSNV